MSLGYEWHDMTGRKLNLYLSGQFIVHHVRHNTVAYKMFKHFLGCFLVVWLSLSLHRAIVLALAQFIIY